jgi:hypothetical protein
MHSATRQIGGLKPKSAIGAMVGVCWNTGGDIQLVGTCISEIEVSKKSTTILPVILRPSYERTSSTRSKTHSRYQPRTFDERERVIDGPNNDHDNFTPITDRDTDG